MHESLDTIIKNLGKASITSPLLKTKDGSQKQEFVQDSERVLLDVDALNIEKMIKKGVTPPSFELAGPRKKNYFDPSKLKCIIVTCGGLSPGLNNVIRAIVLELYYRYQVKNIYGIKYGLQGFIPEYGHEIIEFTPEIVTNILSMGGSILGASRGKQDIGKIIDSLERMNIRLLFMIGGEGTLKVASLLSNEILNRNLKIGVIGIPKTIDNDINLISRSFGFDTAVDVATNSIKSAHNEATGYPNGIGLIKLMGRHSGFIAATATLAQQHVNFVLIPEINFELKGKNGLLKKLEERLDKRKHAVIVVAEGAGQSFLNHSKKKHDPSGNIKLQDIGLFLKEEITSYFKNNKKDINLKYIDPSYMIRSLPANANDNIFCSFLGRDAVHAGMAGKTNLIIGYWNNHFVHIPIETSVGKRKQVNPKGKLWLTVLESTGQGKLTNNI